MPIFQSLKSVLERLNYMSNVIKLTAVRARMQTQDTAFLSVEPGLLASAF